MNDVLCWGVWTTMLWGTKMDGGGCIYISTIHFHPSPSNMFKHLQFVAMERPPYPTHPPSTPSYREGGPKVKTMLLWHFPLIDTCKGKYLWRAYFRYEVVSWKSLNCVTLLLQPRTHDFLLYDFAKICKSQQTPLRNWQNSSSTYYLAICFHISLTTQFENFNTKII